jgi:hypothetical protein
MTKADFMTSVANFKCPPRTSHRHCFGAAARQRLRDAVGLWGMAASLGGFAAGLGGERGVTPALSGTTKRTQPNLSSLDYSMYYDLHFAVRMRNAGLYLLRCTALPPPTSRTFEMQVDHGAISHVRRWSFGGMIPESSER